MKIKSIFTVVMTLLVVGTTFSQITEGVMTYDVFASSDNPMMSSMMSDEEQSTLTVSFEEGKIRTDLTLGSFMTQSTITVKGADYSLNLMDAMMGKIAYKSTKEDFEKMDEKSRQSMEIESVDVTDETKKIAGFTAKKAVATMKGGEKMEIWFTEEIVPAFREGMFLFKEISGLPLEVHTNSFGMEMKFVAYKFKKKLKNPDAVFSLDIPKDFKEMTLEDVMKFRGGGK